MLGFGQKKPSKRKLQLDETAKGQKDIRSFVTGGKSGTSSEAASTSTGGASSSSVGSGGGRGNIFGFGGSSYTSPGSSSGGGGGLATKSRGAGTMVVNPRSRVQDNSSGGSQITPAGTSASVQEAGHRLGASTSQQSEGGVRQKMRDVWSNKFGVPDEKKKKSTDDESECPICLKKVSGNRINEHLDECLTRQSLKDEAVGEPAAEADDDKDGNASVICPNCKREVIEEEFAFHDSVCT
jgi:hypothetical protein